MSQAPNIQSGEPWPPVRDVDSRQAGDGAGAIGTRRWRATLGLIYTLGTWAAAAQVLLFADSTAAAAWDTVDRALGRAGLAVAALSAGVAVALWLGRRWGFALWAAHGIALFGCSVAGALAWPHPATVVHLSIVAVLLLVMSLLLRRPLIIALRPGFLDPLPPAERFRMKAPAKLALGRKPVAGQSVNISVSGVLVTCDDHDLSVGSERLMTLRLGENTFECLGRVARVNGDEVGVAFVGLNRAQQEYLGKLIQMDSDEDAP